MSKCLRLSVWSGPRNISTALMYSFRQRPDTLVVDEPLYAHYLGVTGAAHPGAEEVMAAQPNDGGESDSRRSPGDLASVRCSFLRTWRITLSASSGTF